MAEIPTIEMNDGRRIPQLGFGVFLIPNEQVGPALREALAAGYRSIDTAALYGNEEGVGEAVRASGIPRDELFVTTKVWNDRHGYDETLKAMDESLARLGMDRVDLYLVHWPVPKRDRYVETWRALIRLREEGLALSIGVSNFTPEHLRRIIDETGVVPAVNQIELHPRFQQRALREAHARHGIVTESWSPLARSGLLDEPAVAEVARKHGRSPAQVVLRWHLDSGFVTIPKSVTPARIRENIDIFDFQLDADDRAAFERLDDPAGRIGPDPELLA